MEKEREREGERGRKREREREKEREKKGERVWEREKRSREKSNIILLELFNSKKMFKIITKFLKEKRKLILLFVFEHFVLDT